MTSSIAVVARIRPQNDRERRAGDAELWERHLEAPEAPKRVFSSFLEPSGIVGALEEAPEPTGKQRALSQANSKVLSKASAIGLVLLKINYL